MKTDNFLNGSFNNRQLFIYVNKLFRFDFILIFCLFY